ncbi:hypothetical protein AUJ14_00460 [Candidatus Micrarchaeota archaeon CG1_02_55_22]|nr:MAG: hypothetical protein AUJ14_00460 [Candidatus Micrarchaeota archaeon CG1_02_55_22]
MAENEIVTVSTKFQVVIPKRTRRAGNVRAGQKFTVFHSDGQIVFVPVRGIKSLRGKFGRMDLDDVRDHEDRF